MRMFRVGGWVAWWVGMFLGGLRSQLHRYMKVLVPSTDLFAS
jgi:hypothetical protein